MVSKHFEEDKDWFIKNGIERYLATLPEQGRDSFGEEELARLTRVLEHSWKLQSLYLEKQKENK